MPIDVIPLSTTCSAIYDKRQHACIGISPFNSLFSEAYIESLISWCLKSFDEFHLFIPDEPIIHTLEALGYEPSKAKKKMKKQLNWLRNKIYQSFEANEISRELADNYILDWNFILSSPVDTVS